MGKREREERLAKDNCIYTKRISKIAGSRGIVPRNDPYYRFVMFKSRQNHVYP